MGNVHIILLVMLTFSFNYCSQNDLESGRQYGLKNNDCLNIKDTGYRLCLKGISDSRCPSDVVCVWEGNAKANFELHSSLGDEPFELNTHDRFQQDTIINNLKIELINVLPYPISDNETNQSEYSVEIKVTKV
ncbi:hypothetical protein [Aestuariivivens insulae]|uniref:hypothetical protein n=1 Tax=Aestuariivivens insulae TaxID=1621988 RepID=UPI001F5898E2|nr:hypothetical protein [Aestuariivivens insulae]